MLFVISLQFGTLDGLKVVADVEPDTPAARAGLCTNDLIVAANGVNVENRNDDLFVEALNLQVSPTLVIFREKGAHGLMRSGLTVDLSDLVMASQPN